MNISVTKPLHQKYILIKSLVSQMLFKHVVNSYQDIWHMEPYLTSSKRHLNLHLTFLEHSKTESLVIKSLIPIYNIWMGN